MENLQEVNEVEYVELDKASVVIEYKTMTIWNWVWTLLILSIPFVGFIMLFIWAFSKVDIPKCKKTFARGTLVLIPINIVLLIILFFVTSVSL